MRSTSSPGDATDPPDNVEVAKEASNEIVMALDDELADDEGEDDDEEEEEAAAKKPPTKNVLVPFLMKKMARLRSKSEDLPAEDEVAKQYETIEHQVSSQILHCRATLV